MWGSFNCSWVSYDFYSVLLLPVELLLFICSDEPLPFLEETLTLRRVSEEPIISQGQREEAQDSGSTETNGSKIWLAPRENQEHHIKLRQFGGKCGGWEEVQGRVNPSPVLRSFSKCPFFSVFPFACMLCSFPFSASTFELLENFFLFLFSFFWPSSTMFQDVNAPWQGCVSR